MKKFFTLAIMAVFLVLTGCAKVPTVSMIEEVKAKEFNPPPAGKAGLYLLRPGYFGVLLKKDMYVDKQCVGETKVGIFFHTTVDGNQTHMVSTESEFSPNDIDVYMEEGKNYFVEQYVRMGVFVGGAGLYTIPEKEGKEKIREMTMGVPGICDTTY